MSFHNLYLFILLLLSELTIVTYLVKWLSNLIVSHNSSNALLFRLWTRITIRILKVSTSLRTVLIGQKLSRFFPLKVFHAMIRFAHIALSRLIYTHIHR